MSITINGRTFVGNNVTIINGRVIGAEGGDSVRGNGQVRDEQRSLTDSFHGIEATGIDQLEVVCGRPNEGVILNGESNLLPQLETRVEGGVLHIEPKSGSMFEKNAPVKATLFMESLDQLELSGQVQANVSNLETPRLLLDVSGQCRVSLQGNATRVGAELSGQSWMVADNLSADHVSLDISGQSQAQLGPSKELEVEASGMSQVGYQGSPSLEQDVSGMSRVYRR